MVITPSSFEYNFVLILRICLLVAILLFSIYLARMIILKRRRLGYLEFDFLFSIFIAIVFSFMSYLLSTYYDFILTNFDPNKQYLEPNILYWRIFSLFLVIGLVTILFTIEWKVLNFKLKGIPCTVLIGLTFLFLFYPVHSAEDFKFVLLITSIISGGMIIIIILFIYVGIKSPALRKTSFSVAFGFIIFGIGTQIVNQTIIDPFRELFGTNVRFIFYVLNTGFLILGLFLVSYGMSHFSYAPKTRRLKPVKKLSSSAEDELEKPNMALIETLLASKPAEISEKDISLYRDQNVCLVCKGQLSRYNVYLCPECKVLYCENCVRSLSDLENACWVCDAPFDESKPSKPYKKEEEKVEVKEKNKKRILVKK